MKKTESKKVLKLEKETLIRLQENQMQALIGGVQQASAPSGAACSNSEPPKDEDLSDNDGGIIVDLSCCRKSCRPRN